MRFTIIANFHKVVSFGFPHDPCILQRINNTCSNRKEFNNDSDDDGIIDF